MGLWDDIKARQHPAGFAANPLFMAGLRGLGALDSGNDWGEAMQSGAAGAYDVRQQHTSNQQAQADRAFREKQFAQQQELHALKLKQAQAAAGASEQQNLWLQSPEVRERLAALGLEGAPPSLAMQALGEQLKTQLDKGEWGYSDGVLYNKKTGQLRGAVGGGGVGGGGAGAIPYKQRLSMMKSGFKEYTPASVAQFLATGQLDSLQRATNPETYRNLKSFRDDRRAKAARYDEIHDSYLRVIGATSGKQRKSAPAQLAALVAFTKFLDPGSVAREGEVALAQSAASLMERIKRAADHVDKGAILSQTQITQMVDVMKSIMAGYKNKYDAWREAGEYTSDLYGFDKRAAIGKGLDWSLGGQVALPAFTATTADDAERGLGSIPLPAPPVAVTGDASSSILDEVLGPAAPARPAGPARMVP